MSSFVWQVAMSGYKWERWTDKLVEDQPIPSIREGVYLVAKDWNRFRMTHPLEDDSGLFRNFAETPPTHDGIVNFANVHGHLGEGFGYASMGGFHQSEIKTTSDQAHYDLVQSIPQDLAEWRQSINAIRDCVEIWDEEVAGRASKNAVKRLFETINKNLTSWRFKPQLSQNRPGGQVSFEVVPKNLIAAIWRQFGEAVAGNAQMRKCLGCKTWFQVAPDAFRKNRTTCSDRCRSRVYRDRIDEAGRLLGEGKSVKAIASELDADVSTVNNWLQKLKNRKR